MADNAFGKYRLLAELGHGGTADVFLAVARGPGGFSKLVVIKRLRPNLVEEPEFVAMLVDEARLAGRLNHPNVIQTNEVAQVGNQYYIAMEYLEGQPLYRVLQRSARLQGFPFSMHLRVIADALGGLHHAHELKDFDGTSLHVVHRDATPENIFVTYEGQVKVVDFGIAKAIGRSSETRTGIIKGKVAYMAPEQALGSEIDRRADVFSLGVMLWEAAVGRRMWKGVEDAAILRQLAEGKIPSSPRAVNPKVSKALDRIVRRAIATNASARYATTADFQQDLEQFIETEGHHIASRQLGDFVADLFKDRRAQQRAVIEHQLSAIKLEGEAFVPGPVLVEEASAASLSSGAGWSTDPAVAARRMASPVLVSGPPEIMGAPSTRGKRVTVGATAHAVPARPVRRKGSSGRITGLAIFGAAVAAAVVWATSPRRQAAPAESHLEIASAVAPASATAPLPERKVTLNLRASPEDAQFSIDGGPALGNPFQGEFPRDSRDHTIEIKASGYVTMTKTITYIDDRDLEVSLEREAKPVSRRRAAGPVAKPAQTATTAAGKGKRPIDTEDPWNR
jgi:serine/threonine-protein kinase